MTAITENRTGLSTSLAGIAPVGTEAWWLDIDIGSEYQSEANDRWNFLEIPEGRTLLGFILVSNEDGDGHATPQLDADFVLVQGVDDPLDTGTETVIYNAGTRWQSASTDLVWTFLNTYLAPQGYNGKAYLRWKCVAGAATAVDDFNIKLIVFVK